MIRQYFIFEKFKNLTHGLSISQNVFFIKINCFSSFHLLDILKYPPADTLEPYK